MHPARFWPVQEDASEHSFGGGDDGTWDPNVLDLFTMPHAAWTQEHMLYTYCASTAQRATVHPVGAHMPPYLSRLDPNISRSIERETGGAGCVDSSYQRTPQRRYTAQKVSDTTWTLQYVADPHDLEELGVDEPELQLVVEEVNHCVLRMKITTPQNDRFELPYVREVSTDAHYDCPERMYSWRVLTDPFGVEVTRTETGEVLFHSLEAGTRNLVFKERYVEWSTALPPEADLYGLGEQVGVLRRARQGETVTLWNTDRGTPVGPNLYGSHPFYLDMRDEASHGVFMANSHGMDVVLTPERLTYKMTGGLIDLYLFLGPSVESVTRQYHGLIGLPTLPPFWSMGYHQCRWGYESVEDMQQVADAFTAHELPLDVMWSDIDYMENYKLWTLDPIHYAAPDMQQFVQGLHEEGRHYVMIIDPGVKIEEGYPAYSDGLEEGIFIRRPSGEPTVGKVWPGLVSFIDFAHPQATDFWTRYFQDAYDHQMPFDGLWIDMNEIASFCDGHCVLDTDAGPSLFECRCSQPEYYEEDFPPYMPGGLPPDSSTISMASVHYNDTQESHLHNLYGFLEARATQHALQSIRGGRTFVLSRSTFAGSGHYTAHWLGDNHATWDDMRYSIAGMINMNLYGIPMVGADVCGFEGNTTAELCARWMQLGAFSPFYRNHNSRYQMLQEPYSFGPKITDIARHALQVRYSLLSFLYSHLMEVSYRGGMLVDSLGFLSPHDHTARAIDTQFVLAKSLMVAPVLESQAMEHQVYFPSSRCWYDFFTGEIIVPHEKRMNSTDGVWVTFNEIIPVPLHRMFVFLRGGTIVPVQRPELTSAETRKNPFDLIVALQPGTYASGRLLLDDGETLDAGFTEWLLYTEEDEYVTQLVVNRTRQEYTPEHDVMLRNVTIYGVDSPVNVVYLNGDKELDFAYDPHMRTLVIQAHHDLMDTDEHYFFLVWGYEEKQPLLERVFMLVGSLTFTVALLSFVSIFLYRCGRDRRLCTPPTWLRIPTIPEVPSHQPAVEEGGMEMDEMAEDTLDDVDFE